MEREAMTDHYRAFDNQVLDLSLGCRFATSQQWHSSQINNSANLGHSVQVGLFRAAQTQD
jgi:hypothetical protein